VKDIPGYWNEQYLKLMGVTVPGDKQGCLQDVHWSHGSFGYFPTYSLGSYYAAQFYTCANQSITYLNGLIQQGNNAPLLQWLRNAIHRKEGVLQVRNCAKMYAGKHSILNILQAIYLTNTRIFINFNI
jgi:carboxypeptidase Taq